jgi:hypothetical protein
MLFSLLDPSSILGLSLRYPWGLLLSFDSSPISHSCDVRAGISDNSTGNQANPRYTFS